MKVYFYDDNMVNVSAFRAEHPAVTTVLVKNKEKTPILNGMAGFYYPTLFARKYPNNKYAQALVRNHDILHPKKEGPTEVCRLCTMEVGGGLTVAEIKRIARRAADAVLFDWDLTLSVCNGLPTPEGEYTNTEVAQYYAGTMERFHALREMFTELRLRGTQIFIFTDNGYASSDPDAFTAIVQVLDSALTKEDVVYGNGAKAKTFRTEKRFRTVRNGLKRKKTRKKK